MDILLTEYFWIAAGLLGMSALAIWVRLRNGTIITALGGLHLNVFLFFGLGSLAYLWQSVALEDRVPTARLIAAFSRAGPAFLVGYALAVIWDFRRRRKALVVQPPRSNFRSVPVALLILVLGLIGGWGSRFPFSTSGLGTIFPVLQMLVYPGLAIGVALVSLRRPVSMLIFGVLLAIECYSALFSPWRSELIMLASSIGLGYLWRTHRPFGLIVTLLFAIFILLPFAQEKKLHYQEVTAAPLAAFSRSFAISPQERLFFVADFWAVRIDGARELAYVEEALDSGRIAPRGGLTYWEALQQLVPRLLWPDKPSFNLAPNYYLARQIGLVGWEDPDTSWGVSLYAEAMWNFGAWVLLLFVPIVFMIVEHLDRLVMRSFTDALITQVVMATFFFRFLDVPGAISLVTYILWLLVITKLLDLLLAGGHIYRRYGRPTHLPQMASMALPSRSGGMPRRDP
jgi:hypothetical protein